MAINSYETEINILTEKINSTQDLEFFVQNSYLTTKWKTEMDELVNSSKQIYEELVSQKKEIRNKIEQEKFERSKFTEIKLKQEHSLKDIAVKLYQETIIVHFVDYYSRFEKWMSDLIKLHNELMSVQQKLLECEKALNSPVDCEAHLDAKVNHMLGQIVGGCSPQSSIRNGQSSKDSNSASSSIDSKSRRSSSVAGSDANNNRITSFDSIMSSKSGNIDSVFTRWNKF